MLTLATFLVIFLSGLYYYYWKTIQYWKSRGIPGPTPRIFFGNGREVSSRFTPRPWLVRKWTQVFGSVFGIYEGIFPILYISDHKMVQEVMSTKFADFHARKTNPRLGDVDHAPLINVFNARGERWKRLRAISQTSFTNLNLKKVHPIVQDSALNLLRYLESKEGECFDIIGFYHEFSLDIISRMTMGQKECRMFNNEWLKPIVAMFERDFNIWPMHLMRGAPSLTKLLNWLLTLLGRLTDKDPLVHLTKLTEEAVRTRINERAASTDPWESRDFIDLYLDAQADNVDGAVDLSLGRRLSPAEIVSQLMIFLLAGFDTSSNTLSYTTHFLAKYPEVQRKLQEEIEDYCKDENVSYDSLADLRYMDCVIKEVLRFYPLGANGNVRLCMNETTVGGVLIEKGILVAVDVISVQFDQEIWGEDAEEFRPERWLSSDIKAHQFLAFGSGPRICLGVKLAYLEIKMALVHILRRFRFTEGTETEAALTLAGSITIAPESVHVRLVKQ